jgi:spore coat polysaccharide biosynthesis protein SpsF (cytidylyltransferase family)
MRKIGALIPIRLASERLPGKALKEICHRPALYHLLDRVCASLHIEKENIVVCTTEDASDDSLVDIVETYGVKIFRGSKDDIIKRFYDAIQYFNFDYILQIDGDDLLADPIYMGLTMTALLNDNTIDIATCEGLPLGIATKSFTRSAIEKVYKHYKTHKNDTGFIYFFTKTGLCKQKIIYPLSPEHLCNEARLTLDYPEDFDVFKNIIETLYQPDNIFSLETLVNYLKSNPDIMKKNQFLNKQYWERTNQLAQLQYIDSHGVLNTIN